MKQIFFLLAFVAISLFGMAQANQLVWANGRVVYGTPVESIDSLTWGDMQDVDTLQLLLPRVLLQVVHDTVLVHDTIVVHDTVYINPADTLPTDTVPSVPQRGSVDLGLSVKWATCNVGAETPEQAGHLFSWGETTVKTSWKWDTYQYYENDKLTKYNTVASNGEVDSKITLEAEDDAATVYWGDAWRMPTTTEIKELIDQCTWTWTTQEEVNGYKVVGPNGNSIFLPVTGYGYMTYHMQPKNEARYWSSSLQAVDMTTHGQGVYFKASEISWGSYYRYLGCAVRPVCK